MKSSIEQRKPGRISSALSVFERNIDKNREVAAAEASAAPNSPSKKKSFFKSFGRRKRPDENLSESFRLDSKNVSPNSNKKDGKSKVTVYAAMDDDDSSKELNSVLNLTCIVQPMYDMSRNESRKEADVINRKLICSNDDSVRSELSSGSLKNCRASKHQKCDVDVSDGSNSSSVSSRRCLSVSFNVLGSQEFSSKDDDESVVSTTSSRLSSKLQKSPYRSTGRKKIRIHNNVENKKESMTSKKLKKSDNRLRKAHSNNTRESEADNDSSDFNSEHLIPFDDNQIQQFNPVAIDLHQSTNQCFEKDPFKSIETTSNHCMDPIKDIVPTCPTRQKSMMQQNKKDESTRKSPPKKRDVYIDKTKPTVAEKGVLNSQSNILSKEISSDEKKTCNSKIETGSMKCSNTSDSRRTITGQQTRRLSSGPMKVSSMKDTENLKTSEVENSNNKFTQPIALRRASTTGRQQRRSSAEALKSSLQTTENRLSRKGNSFETSTTDVIQESLLKKQQQLQQCKLKDQVNFQILRQDLRENNNCKATTFHHSFKEAGNESIVYKKLDNNISGKIEAGLDNKENLCENKTTGSRTRSSSVICDPPKSTYKRRNSTNIQKSTTQTRDRPMKASKQAVIQPENPSFECSDEVNKACLLSLSPTLKPVEVAVARRKASISTTAQDSPSRNRKKLIDDSKDTRRVMAAGLEKGYVKNLDIQSIANSHSKIVMEQQQQQKLVRKIVLDAETVLPENCSIDKRDNDSPVGNPANGFSTTLDKQIKSCLDEADISTVSKPHMYDNSKMIIQKNRRNRESSSDHCSLKEVGQTQQQKRPSVVPHDSLNSSQHSQISMDSKDQPMRRIKNKNKSTLSQAYDSPKRERTTPIESPAPPVRSISASSDASTVKTGSHVIKGVDNLEYLISPPKSGKHRRKGSATPVIGLAPLSHSSQSDNRKVQKIRLNMLQIEPTSNAFVHETTDGKTRKIILSASGHPSSSVVQSPHRTHAEHSAGSSSPRRAHKTKSAGFGLNIKSPAVDKSRKSRSCDEAPKSPGRAIITKSPCRHRSKTTTEKSRPSSSTEQQSSVPLTLRLQDLDRSQLGVQVDISRTDNSQEVHETLLVPAKNFKTFQKRKEKLMLSKLLLSTSLTNVFAVPPSVKNEAKVFHSSAPQLKVEGDDEGEKLKGILRDADTVKQNLHVTFYDFLPTYNKSKSKPLEKSMMATTRKLQLKFDGTDAETFPWINSTVIVIQCFYRGWKSRMIIQPALIKYRIQCVGERKKQDLLKIQHDKWQSMEMTHKRMERKYEKSTTNLELADKLKAVLTRDNDKLNGQIDILKEYCDHLTLMNQHFEQSTVQMINSYDCMKISLDILDEQNTTLLYKLQTLETLKNNIITEAHDTDMLLEMERKSISLLDDTIDGMLNTMKGRCKNTSLLQHVFDLGKILSPKSKTEKDFTSSVIADDDYEYDAYDVGTEQSDSSETIISSCSTDLPESGCNDNINNNNINNNHRNQLMSPSSISSDLSNDS